MRYVQMAIVLALTCFGPSAGQAADAEERESLRGLAGVAVVIEKLDPDARADGLSEEAIRTAVELILRSSGIRVFTFQEIAETFSLPLSFLYMNVGTLKVKSMYALNVNLWFNQQVSLVHRPQRTMLATTWHAAGVGIVGKDNLSKIIPVNIEPRVKEFANDFLAVNPR